MLILSNAAKDVAEKKLITPKKEAECLFITFHFHVFCDVKSWEALKVPKQTKKEKICCLTVHEAKRTVNTKKNMKNENRNFLIKWLVSLKYYVRERIDT